MKLNLIKKRKGEFISNNNLVPKVDCDGKLPINEPKPIPPPTE